MRRAAAARDDDERACEILQHDHLMIAQQIGAHALREPNRVAIKHGGRHLTYRLADQQLRRLQAGLLSARVTEYRLVGVAHSDPLVETLLLFALEALGVATLPFVQPADAGIVAALRECDLLVCEQPIDGLRGPYALITAAWLQAVVNHRILPELVMRRKPAGQTVNVFTTSGSMGIAKSIVFDARAVEARIASRLAQYGLERSSRLLAALPPSTSGTFFVAQAVLRVGGTLVYFDETSALSDLAECTHALMLPVMLDRLAKQTQSQASVHRRIKIFAVGAKLGESTRALAKARLNAELMDAYGTTETGWLAMFGEASVGDVLPGVDLEVVGPDDQPLPAGEAGQVRARSPEMGSGYLDRALSSTAFRDGWYYTGDLARMPATRRIELIGREDAILNFGGIKISPETIEAALMARSIAADVAALSRAGADGIAQLWLALVAPRLADDALDREVVLALGHNLGPIQVVLVDQVPRNPAGKLMRAEVRALVERQLDGR